MRIIACFRCINGEPSEAILHKEKLNFNDVELKQRSYKYFIMDLLLKIWRQKNRQDKGGLEDYKVTGISKIHHF